MDEVWCHDGIEISRLSLDKPHCIGTDAWGRRKEQPVLVSVRFAFRNGFDSAAQTDSLDQSTVNYGQASKRIKAIKSVAPWESLDDFCKRLYQVVLDCLPGPRTIESCLLRVHLPKASLMGSEVIVSSGYQHLVGVAWPKLERTLQLHRMHVPILVGIHEHERKQKQPLIFSLSLQDVPAAVLDAYSRIEESLYQVGAFVFCKYHGKPNFSLVCRLLKTLALRPLNLLHCSSCTV